MKRCLLTLSFVALATAAHALPSADEVQAQVRQGDYARAESMMREVVAAKPASAKAHYVYAEILAHNGRFASAAEEAASAKRLDPSLKFAQPEKFQAFEQLLEREQRRARSAASPLDALGPSSLPAATVAAPAAPLRDVEAAGSRAGLPAWVWPAALLAIAFVAWRLVRRGTPMPSGSVRASPGYAATPAYPTGTAFGSSPGMGPVAGGGGGLMGVGLAAAAGVAAGMLAEKLLERGHERRAADGIFDGSVAPSPGSDPDARALEDRDVDFGTGDDWGDVGSTDMGSADDGGW